MLVWAIASQKGGVGKTTTVASLAGWLQKEGLRVLLIDTDPHASLTAYLGFEDAELNCNLYDLYKENPLSKALVEKAIVHTQHEGLDLIASTMALATIDRQLSGRAGVGRILSKVLEFVRDDYDVALIDCPPVLGALMVNALVASSMILVPTQTEFLALKGLEGMVKTFSIMEKAAHGGKIDYLVVPTMYDKRTSSSQSSLDYLKMHYRSKLWSEVIPIDTRFRESSSRHIPLPLMDKKSRGAQAYLNLLKHCTRMELERHCDLVSPALAALLEEDTPSESVNRHTEDLLADDVGTMLTQGVSSDNGAGDNNASDNNASGNNGAGE